MFIHIKSEITIIFCWNSYSAFDKNVSRLAIPDRRVNKLKSKCKQMENGNGILNAFPSAILPSKQGGWLFILDIA